VKHLIAATLLMLACTIPVGAQDSGQDPGWPREMKKNGSTLVYYQPQVDEWKGFTQLAWRMAFSLTPKGGKEVVGVVEMQGVTDVDNDEKMVTIHDLKVNETRFPSLDSATAGKMEQLLRTFLPPTVSISLHRLVASVQKPTSVPGVSLKNDPPDIIVSEVPAILLAIEGAPQLAAVPKTKLEFVINTTWPLFFDKSNSAYYLLIGEQWATATSLDGPWTHTTQLPKDMTKVAADPQWAALKKLIPPPAQASGALPTVFHRSVPAEVVLFDGKPVYAKISGTQLVYSTNTSSYWFVDTATNDYYYLTGGRWFRSRSMKGPWVFATTSLPADFSRIPESDPASIVLASVPGTDEAKDAVLLAQVPTTLSINPATAAKDVKVSYGGEPKFVPIEGTPLAYATNTQDKVIKDGDVYYLCLQGVWFMSTTAQGPWTVASSIPQVIYTIPPSSPVYNVTYVTQTTVSSGQVQSSYTAGYMGAFVVGVAVGAVIANGSGYYYPPYVYRPPYGYPVYYPHPCTYGMYGSYGTVAHYNPNTGAYGVSHTAYGPYGTATRGASYNPYTGTSARGASVSTPYGSRSAAQAYNPYTGTYAATRQGSSPTAQWGSSVVSNGNRSAYTQHYSTAQGTVSSAQGSAGGKAVATSSAYGHSSAGKAASGDMYATHNGDVYRNTGSGWQSYDNGSWNTANKPTTTSTEQRAQASQATAANQAAAQERAQSSNYQHPTSQGSVDHSSQMQGLQQESANRERGAQQSDRFAQSRERSFGGRRR
jgi:hypothetical protein